MGVAHPQSRLRYGLDFGTSNSAIALLRGEAVEVLPVDPHAANPNVASSVVYIERNGASYIGAQAIDVFVARNTGREIQRKRVTSGQIIETAFGEELVQFDIDTDIPGRFFQAIKTFLPDGSFEGTMVFGRFYTIEELAALLIRQLKARADALVGHNVDAVVMGRPVLFSADKKADRLAQERLKEAAHLAGFNEVEFLYEPLGAALTYQASIHKPQVAFVFDFGGGTLDFTVIRLYPAQHAPDILAVGGVVVGGNTFDEDIMEKRLVKYFGSKYVGKTMTGADARLPLWILRQLRTWYTIPFLNERKTITTIRELAFSAKKGRSELLALLTLIQKNYGWELFQEIERAKLELSERESTVIAFQRENIKLREPLTRRNFETIISHRLHVIHKAIDQTLARAGLTPSDIDVVIRTGGSSLIPAVQTMLEEKFGASKVDRQEVFTSVVQGLARAAAQPDALPFIPQAQ